MTDKVICEIYLVIDVDGDYGVGADEGEAIDVYNNNIGRSGPLRIVKINAKVTPPILLETEIDVPDESGEIKQVEIAAE